MDRVGIISLAPSRSRSVANNAVEMTSIVAVAAIGATAPSLARLADKLNKVMLVALPELRGLRSTARQPGGSGNLTSGETSTFPDRAHLQEPNGRGAATGPDFA
jgi:hypothetical protein